MNKKLTMYCLYPYECDNLFFVMSDTKRNAFNAIKKTMKKEDKERSKNYINCNTKYNSPYHAFYNKGITYKNLPGLYKIVEYNINEVYI